MILPILIAGIPISSGFIALFVDPLQFFPHVIHIILLVHGQTNSFNCTNNNYYYNIDNNILTMLVIIFRVLFFVFIIYKQYIVLVKDRRQKRVPAFLLLLTSIILHLVWIGFFLFVKTNAVLAINILFAPFPKVIQL